MQSSTYISIECEENVISEKLDGFFLMNNLAYTTHDVYFTAITEKQFKKYMDASIDIDIIPVTVLEIVKDTLSDYLFLLFYHYCQYQQRLFIFGIISLDEMKPSIGLKYGMLKMKPTNEYISNVYEAFSKSQRRYMHSRLENNKLKCSLYTEMDLDVKTNTDAVMWRIKLIHIIYSSSRTYRKDKQNYVFTNIERYLNKCSMSHPSVLFNVDNVKLDNESYHLCKLITLYDELFKREMIEAEQYFVDYKLKKYHLYERDILTLLCKNKMNKYLTLDFIKRIQDSEEGLDSEDQEVLELFNISRKDIMNVDSGKFESTAVFCVPFEMFGFEKERKSPVIQYINGKVFFSYLDIDIYLKKRIYRDIYFTTQTIIAKKQNICYKECLKKRYLFSKQNAVEKMKKVYRDKSPLSVKSHTKDVEVLEKTVIKPVLSKIEEFRSMRYKQKESCVDITFNVDASTEFTNQYNKYDSDDEEEEQEGEEVKDHVREQINMNQIRKYKDTTLYELIMPPCINRTLEMASKDHLKNDIRIPFLNYLVSSESMPENELAELWKDICDMPEGGSDGSRGQTFEEFMSKNSFAGYLKYAIKLHKRSKENSENSICYSCDSIAKFSFGDVQGTKMCPYTEIEDAGDFKQMCRNDLKNKIKLYKGTVNDYYNPRKYYKEAFRMVMSSD